MTKSNALVLYPAALIKSYMRYLSCICLLLVTVTASAQSSLNRYEELSPARAKLTSEFAKIQNQLRSKERATITAGEKGLSQLAPKIESMRDDLVKANQRIIEALNPNYTPPGYGSNDLFYGLYDPSATIVATLGKLMKENQELNALSLPNTAPFSPQDLNAYQKALDRMKRAIDEHRHAANNYETTVTQRQRKRAEPSKTPAKLPK